MQKAIDAILQPALAAMTPPVALYDLAPENAPYPFVEFARTTETPDDELASNTSRIQTSLAVYSDARGQRQVHSILAVIKSTLDDADLTLAAGRCVRIDLDRADCVRDQDGVTYTGTALFTSIVQAPAP